MAKSNTKRKRAPFLSTQKEIRHTCGTVRPQLPIAFWGGSGNVSLTMVQYAGPTGESEMGARRPAHARVAIGISE